jgi:uncharacterized protein
VIEVFADTSGLYAVLDRDDANHPRARAIWQRVLTASKLITNNYVLVETTALVQRRLGMVALRTFVYDVMPLLRVEWITEAEHQAALNMVLTSGRKELSLVDCMSFQTMRSAGVSKAFCFDTHFRQQGFETL